MANLFSIVRFSKKNTVIYHRVAKDIVPTTIRCLPLSLEDATSVPIHPIVARKICQRANSLILSRAMGSYLLFWYHVFTCVSVSCSFAASSILSCTLRYFCRSKLFSRVCSWWSVKAVRAFRCFLLCAELSVLDEELFGSSSLPPEIPGSVRLGRFAANRIAARCLIY